MTAYSAPFNHEEGRRDGIADADEFASHASLDTIKRELVRHRRREHLTARESHSRSAAYRHGYRDAFERRLAHAILRRKTQRLSADRCRRTGESA
jgi:hypothetical protein